MKRICAGLICISVLLSFSSCNKAVLQELKELYPDSKIESKDGIYKVISDNVDINDADTAQQYGVSDGPVYNDMKQLLQALNPVTAVIFIGKKTGESRQVIPILANSGDVDGMFETHSKVQVTKAYYGDINEGDVITYYEPYATFNGEQKIMRYLYKPINDGEYLFVCYRYNQGSLYDGGAFYGNAYHDLGAVDIEHWEKTLFNSTMSPLEKISYDLYDKYIRKNDTALDRTEQIKKAENYYNSINQEVPEKQLEIIDRLIQKYGEKGE